MRAFAALTPLVLVRFKEDDAEISEEKPLFFFFFLHI